jgi:excisionase family DNA binding protein
MYDGLVTADEAGELLGITGGTVRRYIRAGHLEVIRRVGKTQLLRLEDVEAFDRPPRGRPRKAEKVVVP